MEKLHLADLKAKEAKAKKAKAENGEAGEAADTPKAKPIQRPMSKLDRELAAEKAKAEAKEARRPLPPPPLLPLHPPHTCRGRARPCTTALSPSPVRGASRAQKAAERERKKEERAQKAALPKKPKSGFLLYSGPPGSKCPRSTPLRSAVARRPSPGRRPAPQSAAAVARQRASVVAWRSPAGRSRRRVRGSGGTSSPRRHRVTLASLGLQATR
jgi:hypothetical protein